MAPSVSDLATSLSDANTSLPMSCDTISPVNGTNSASDNDIAPHVNGPYVNGSATHTVDSNADHPPVNGSATHTEDSNAARPPVNGSAAGDSPADLIANYDVLIVGTGPAGASLACVAEPLTGG